MTDTQLLISILICAAVTIFTRAAAFLVFRSGKTPRFITWLGNLLPGAVMAMLVVYCLKDVSFASASGCVPALTGVAATSLLHIWKKNMMLSICGGTAVYMLLLSLI